MCENSPILKFFEFSSEEKLIEVQRNKGLTTKKTLFNPNLFGLFERK